MLEAYESGTEYDQQSRCCCAVDLHAQATEVAIQSKTQGRKVYLVRLVRMRASGPRISLRLHDMRGLAGADACPKQHVRATGVVHNIGYVVTMYLTTYCFCGHAVEACICLLSVSCFYTQAELHDWLPCQPVRGSGEDKYESPEPLTDDSLPF